MSKRKESELGLIWVKYKIRKGSLRGVKLKASLEVDLKTQEFTGFTYLYSSKTTRLSKISYLRGNVSYESKKTNSTMKSSHVLFVAEGLEMSSTEVKSQENLKLKMFLKPDLLSGTAFFEYLDNGKWYKFECYNVSVAKSIGANVKEFAHYIDEKNIFQEVV